MDYIELLQQRLSQQSAKSNLLNLIDEGVDKLHDKIIDLNIQQIDNYVGFDDKMLFNPNYKGVYSLATQNFAKSKGLFKPAGTRYDFDWTGAFRKGFYLKDAPNGYAIESLGIFNSADKREFFEGYTNMFGLNSDNSATIESEVLYYVYENVFLNIYE